MRQQSNMCTHKSASVIPVARRQPEEVELLLTSSFRASSEPNVQETRRRLGSVRLGSTQTSRLVSGVPGEQLKVVEGGGGSVLGRRDDDTLHSSVQQTQSTKESRKLEIIRELGKRKKKLKVRCKKRGGGGAWSGRWGSYMSWLAWRVWWWGVSLLETLPPADGGRWLRASCSL